MARKLDYDQIVLNIEFLLISVIQGVAFSTLLGYAAPIINNGQTEYWLYITAGFLIVLVFWSHAIIHALSFIDWPLDLFHSFLYFLVIFFQVLSLSQMTNPLHWFITTVCTFLVAWFLYVWDYFLIKKHEKAYSISAEKKKLYTHIVKRHLFEMNLLIPAGLFTNIISLILIVWRPRLFLDAHLHIALISLQVLFILGMLGNAIDSFKKRAYLISACLES